MFPQWDSQLLLLIQEYFQNDFLDTFFVALTSAGDKGYLWIGLGVLLICFKKTRATGVLLLISLLLTHIINTVWLKEIVDRPRPYEVLPQIRNLVGIQGESSFPSGHAATAFGSAFVPALRHPGWFRWTVLPVALLMAFSRLYVGVHYPLDVLVGSLIGILIASLVVYFGQRIIRNYHMHKLSPV